MDPANSRDRVIILTLSEIALLRDMPVSQSRGRDTTRHVNGNKQDPPWRKWFYGASDNNNRVGKTISYVWRPFSLRNPVFSSYSISLRACLLDTWGECHFECTFYNRCRVLRAKSSRYTFRSKNFRSRKCDIARRLENKTHFPRYIFDDMTVITLLTSPYQIVCFNHPLF